MSESDSEDEDEWDTTAYYARLDELQYSKQSWEQARNEPLIISFVDPLHGAVVDKTIFFEQYEHIITSIKPNNKLDFYKALEQMPSDRTTWKFKSDDIATKFVKMGGELVVIDLDILTIGESKK